MKRIAFLCSGGGGNLRFIKECVEMAVLPDAELSAVITDRDCPALKYAKRKGMPCFRIDYTRRAPEKLATLLAEFDPDVIVTNIHKILDVSTVSQYQGRLINLHYSLLPAFKGLIGAEPVRQACELGCRFIGTTVHYLAAEVDAGPIISQSALPVGQDTPFDMVMDNIFRGGCINLVNGIERVLNSATGKTTALFTRIGASLFTPVPRLNTAPLTDDFWESIKSGWPRLAEETR